ncbi:hypothetical protein KJK34_06235 [Flavobacterium sp. D11R37]|uniref:hypothetical protein n=1 Tax=Flavobacterium coralii TaxID=2838017 RepID=UPI001CA6A062|nr:hypothetical protein [Flavobacterium coralii]MBY8962343.1 hypothetical protein [Flavobacterium coralii]
MKTISILLCFLIISCGVPSIPYNKELYFEPDLELFMTREVGDKIIESGERGFRNAYKIISISKDLKILNISFPYKQGDVLPISEITPNYYLYHNNTKVIFNNIAYTVGLAENKKDGSIKPFINSINGFEVKHTDDLKLEKYNYYIDGCNNCFRNEIVYSGKSGNTIKFMYREYIDDLARPSFYQELQYDLTENNIIGFRGSRIEILKVTNTQIEYRIIKHFN